ncbi:MAG: 8-amino-7-oxononanoate synthase [Gammaproteobacteria bacterium]|nr:MAG: 8-amino-7-oxononanoate synthase [Gammaproteobacteria bacterium]
MKSLQRKLAHRRVNHLYRQRLVNTGPQQTELAVEGGSLLSFCSNDYLGLASDPRVITAWQQGANQYGVGTGASHLVSGHSEAHRALEEELATFVGAQRALLFSTGYMANQAIMTTLMGSRQDCIYEDRLNHASLIDAARLAQARVRRYRHADNRHLQQLMADRGSGQALVSTDGVFSMDGDIAPVPELLHLVQQHNAYLLIDDAHGFGVLGSGAGGTLQHYNIEANDSVILMATLGKAAGVFGAFVAGSEELIETLIQFARTYIYTTALPPALAEAVRASLRIIRQEPERRQTLHERVAQFRTGAKERGLVLMESSSPIQPLVLGASEQALQVSQALRKQGILVTAMRPPTVPDDTARLRITLCCQHSVAQVERLLDNLAAVLP